LSENYIYSRPYGEAAFKLAVEDKSIKNWSIQLAELSAIVSDPQTIGILSDPKIDNAMSLKFLSSFLDDANNKSFLSFLSLLIETKRIVYMQEIAEIFESLKFKHNNIRVVEVESAHEVSADQLDSLTSLLKDKYQSEVKVKVSVNKALMAGLKIKSNNEVIDLTIKSRLDQMEQQLII
jgi:F-type H+-transporting ATPase subunit delta